MYSAPGMALVADWLNSFHVYAFTLVSGYLYAYLRYERGKYKRFIPFVCGKAKRLLIPYAFISIVWVIPFELYFFDHSITETIAAFVLGTSPGQLWFLLMLFWVFVIFYLLSDFFRKHSVAGGLFVILLYGIGLIGQSIFANIFQIFRAFMYIPMFWMGFQIRMKWEKLFRRVHCLGWLLADIVIFALTQYLIKQPGVVYLILRMGMEFVLHIIGASMAFSVLQKIAMSVNWRDCSLFRFLSRSSMTVYLFHQQIVYIFVFWFNGVLNPYLHAGVNFLAAMGVSLLIATIFRRFKLTRLLLGEK